MDQPDYLQGVARVLAVTGVVLLVTWVLFHTYLPWWASALLLASVPLAAIEAVRMARRAGSQ